MTDAFPNGWCYRVSLELGRSGCALRQLIEYLDVRSLFSLVLFAVCFWATAPPCWANLGDTLEQSVARYGKPIAQGKGDSTDAGYPWYTFNYGKFEIEETFTLSGKKCWMELWWKKDRSPMSESDQLAILTENANAEKWGNTKEGVEGIRSWIRTDGATAQYDPMRGNNTVGNEMLLAITQKDTDPSHR
jgi:hypothetical protein